MTKTLHPASKHRLEAYAAELREIAERVNAVRMKRGNPRMKELRLAISHLLISATLIDDARKKP